jgi:hypothetical protein
VKEGDALLGQVKRGDKGLGYLLPEIIVDSIILGQILAFRVLTSQSDITYNVYTATCMHTAKLGFIGSEYITRARE